MANCQRSQSSVIWLCGLFISALISVSELHAQPMWNAESIANTSAATVNLTDGNGKTLGTVPVAFAKMLVVIKNKIQAVAGIQSELWIQAGSSPNAWATPYEGRYIIAFNLPMLIACGNDKDALAAVMGHETAHLVRRHSPARKNNSSTVDTFGAFFSGLFEGVIQNKYQVSGIGNAIAEIGVELAKTSFTRDQEREADKYGLIWMNDAGYDPNGALRLWKKMEGISPSTEFTFLSTHPSHSERIENLTQQIASLPSRRNIVATNTSSYPMAKTPNTKAEPVDRDMSQKYTLAVNLFEGRDIPKDYNRALQLFEEVYRNHDQAADYIGLIYRDGLGVSRDLVRAYAWFTIGPGSPTSKQIRRELESQLSPQQIKDAELLVQQILAQPEKKTLEPTKEEIAKRQAEQIEKMKSCNSEAASRSLQGPERTAFMRQCLQS